MGMWDSIEIYTLKKTSWKKNPSSKSRFKEKKNPILIQEEKEPIFDFDETKDEEIVVLNESSHKAPDSEFTSPDSDIEETMQV